MGALFNNNGNQNTATGYQALNHNTDGEANTATGIAALFTNNSYFNTANGDSALYYNTIGSENTANGDIALFHNTTGSYNTASGGGALLENSTGDGNTALGINAGYSVTSGSDNTFLGDLTNCGLQGTLNNSTAIGSGATVTSSNTVRVGDNYITSVGGFVDWTNISDGRVKKNIKQNVPGLSFINKLNPITYNLDLDAADKIIQRPAIKDRSGKIIQPSAERLTSRREKQQIVYTGFIAQDVEKAAKELSRKMIMICMDCATRNL